MVAPLGVPTNWSRVFQAKVPPCGIVVRFPLPSKRVSLTANSSNNDRAGRSRSVFTRSDQRGRTRKLLSRGKLLRTDSIRHKPRAKKAAARRRPHQLLVLID